MTLQEIVDRSERLVFFGGAGVSTESGIPDFRSTDGLYHQQYDYPPEMILSHSFFVRNPAEFYRFYRNKILLDGIEPNAAHKALAALEAAGKLTAVVTQNIDGLHQKAGSQNVFELHGSALRHYCMDCGKSYPLEAVRDRAVSVPRCSCGGIIRPDVVLYEEPLDEAVVTGAIRALAEADTLIVGGTSLVVYPAAGLLRYFGGHTLVLINKSATNADRDADLVIREPIGQVLGSLKI
ncbi:MAG: NAD-dependent protein deacylase [Clostridia bacterium]|nr:NAD-dependent protein deacylase [Clostridia bacterium]